MGMTIAIKDFEMPNTCGDCPCCIYTADEKRYIGYCNTSDDDYFCKALDRFMEYDKVDGGVDILGKPSDCPLVEVIPKADYENRLKADMVAMLEDLDLQIDESAAYNLEVAKVQRLIRDNINTLKAEIEPQESEE